jgi:hypothetical protein
MRANRGGTDGGSSNQGDGAAGMSPPSRSNETPGSGGSASPGGGGSEADALREEVPDLDPTPDVDVTGTTDALED